MKNRFKYNLLLGFALLIPILSLGQTYTVTTLAGSGEEGSNNGVGANATFHEPYGVVVDSRRNVYVTDSYNHLIRKINSAGIVTTFAGSGIQGSTNGTGTAASFSFPQGIAIDANNNLYVTESPGRIRKITPAGVVSTLAGSTIPGYADATGTNAQFSYPRGLAVDAVGNVYVSDGGNHRIRKITSGGVVTTIAGSGGVGEGNGAYLDSTSLNARFYFPEGLSIDRTGNLYVADLGNSAIRKISINGQVTTLAGTDTFGFADGTGNAARFDFPYGTAVDASGNVYVADGANRRIRKISPSGVVSTIAGSGTTPGNEDGLGSVARFYNPTGIAVDIYGNIYVADNGIDQIRKIRDLNCVIPAIPTITGAHTVCEGSSIILTSSALTGNLWSTGDTTRTITVSEAGTYYLQRTSGACISDPTEFFEVESVYCGPLFSGNGSYSNTSNWANSTIPAQGSSIRITGKMTLSQSVTYSDVRLMNGASIEIADGITLTITGFLNNAGVISGNGVVELSGANGQTFSGGIVSNLYINNGSTVVQHSLSRITNSLILGNNQILNLSGQPTVLQSNRQKTAQLAEVPSTSSIINANLFMVERWLDSLIVRNGATNTGNYYLLGPVVQGQTFNLWNPSSRYNSQTFTGTGVGNLYLYNPTANNWYKPSSQSTALPVGAGVQVWFGSSTFFNNAINTWLAIGVPQVGDYNLPFTAERGFHLLSNPYPSTIDWDSPNWTKTNVANAIYIYDWVNRRYKSYIDGVGANGGSRYLPTAQGFLIWAETTSPVLTAREGIKVSNQVALQRTESQVTSIVRMQVRRGSMTDEVVIAHRPNTQLAFEPQIDARKMMNPAANVFVGGTVRQSIATMDLNTASVIPIELLSDSTGMVTLITTEFSGVSGGPYYLVDEVTTEVYPYTPESTFQFYLNANERYSLSLRLNNVNSLSNLTTNSFEVYPNPVTDKVTIRTNGTGSLEIVNVVGQVVLTQPATETNEINVSKLAKGIYTVKFNGASQKLVVK
jgi:sugar lactone lactonase YvrE